MYTIAKPCTCEAAKGRYSTHLPTCPAYGEIVTPGATVVQTTPLVYCAHPEHYRADHTYVPGVCIMPGRVIYNRPVRAWVPMQAGATTTSSFD